MASPHTRSNFTTEYRSNLRKSQALEASFLSALYKLGLESEFTLPENQCTNTDVPQIKSTWQIVREVKKEVALIQQTRKSGITTEPLERRIEEVKKCLRRIDVQIRKMVKETQTACITVAKEVKNYEIQLSQLSNDISRADSKANKDETWQTDDKSKEEIRAWRLEKHEHALKEQEGMRLAAEEAEKKEKAERLEKWKANEEIREAEKRKVQEWKESKHQSAKEDTLQSAPIARNRKSSVSAIDKEGLDQWRREREEREREEKVLQEIAVQEKTKLAHEEWRKLKDTGELDRRHQRDLEKVRLKKSQAKEGVKELPKIQPLVTSIRDPARATGLTASARMKRMETETESAEKAKGWWQAPNISAGPVAHRASVTWRG